MQTGLRGRDLIALSDWTNEEIETALDVAFELKRKRALNEPHALLRDKVLAMLFFFSSTRTRASFEAGMAQLGGSAMFLSPRDTQLGRGEPIEDTARVLSRMVDCVMIRTFEQADIETFAAHSRVPVINGLTDLCHPCQLLADMQTFAEHRGDIRGKTVAWVGDGNNMCHSYMAAAEQFDFKLNIACPEGYDPDPRFMETGKGRCSFTRSPKEAVTGADLVVTDTWISMGQEDEKAHREQAFAGYMIDRAMMDLAAPEALFLHCLPAYRGKEVSADLLDAPDSVVWEEAENRMHAQRAILATLIK